MPAKGAMVRQIRCVIAGLRRRRDGRDAGQALVELAVVLPLLLLMLLGAIDLGRLAFLAVEVTSAARAGTMYGAQSQTTAQDTAGMQLTAQNDADVTLKTASGARSCRCSGGTADVSCTSTTPCPSGQRMVTYVTVTAAVDYVPWFPYPGVPGTMTITRTASMRVGQ
jgi:Flp pilus assembly protein TadG